MGISDDDNYKVRVTKTYTDNETGITVWEGDVFNGLTDKDRVTEHGDEVKVAGEYIWVPAENLEIVTELRPTDRIH